jgi:hypothetical protein
MLLIPPTKQELLKTLSVSLSLCLSLPGTIFYVKLLQSTINRQWNEVEIKLPKLKVLPYVMWIIAKLLAQNCNHSLVKMYVVLNSLAAA